MKRRTFFKTTALSSSAVALSGIAACTGQINSEKSVEKELTSFDLNEVTIDQLQQQMVNNELTSAQICEMYLERMLDIQFQDASEG